MTDWATFAAAAPEMAAAGRARIEATELVLVGTIKADGSPRISPIEPDFVDGELMFGMMWQSHKARDLLRDPRCVVHSAVSNRHGTEGELKIIGTAVEVADPQQRGRYQDTIEARIGLRPEEPFHLFAVDLQRVWWIVYTDDDRTVLRWPA
jgi:hypothetical protein